MVAGLLAALAIAMGCPEPSSAEIPSAGGSGGAVAPPATPHGAPDPALDPSQQHPPEDASAGGGATAPPTAPAELAPAAEPAREAPTVAPTADPPSLEPGARSVQPPTAAGPPANVNVDIRIFSPGDNGDVVQLTGSDGGAGAPSGPVVGADWDWDWDWTCDPAASPPATAAGWKWDWDWDCGGLTGARGDRSKDGAARTPSELPRRGAARPPDGLRPQGIAPEQSGPSPAAGRSEPREVEGGGAPFKPARIPAAAGPVAGYAVPLAATAPQRSSPSLETRRARNPEAGERSTGPFEMPAVARPAASAPGPPGGSSSVLLVVLLGALSLIAPRALGPVWARIPSFASFIGSRRLERPG